MQGAYSLWKWYDQSFKQIKNDVLKKNNKFMIGRTREVLALIGLALAMAILIIFDSVISNQTYCTIYFVLFIIFMIAIFELLVKRLQKSSISTLSRYF